MKTNWVLVLIGLYLVALQTSMAGMEILGGLLVLAAGVALVKRKAKLKWSLDETLISFLLIAVLISVVLADPAIRNWQDLGFMRWILLFISLKILLPNVMDEKHLNNGIKILAMLVALSGLYAVFQGLTGIDFIRPDMHKVTEIGGMWRATGPFSMSITYASVIGMGTMALLAWSWVQGRIAILIWPAVILGLLAIVFTTSRASFLGVIIVTLALLVVIQPRRLIWGIAFLLLVFNLVVYLNTDITARLSTFGNLHRDSSTLLRLGIWRGYWQIFMDHPWFGVGLFSPVKLLPEYHRMLGIQTGFFSHGHSNSLQWLAGAGIFAYLAYLALSLRFLFQSLKFYFLQRTTFFGALALALFAGQLLFHIEGLIECNFFDAEVNHQIIFFWALTSVLVTPRKSR